MTDPDIRLVDPTKTMMTEYLDYARSFVEDGETREGPGGEALVARLETALLESTESAESIFADYIREKHPAEYDVERPDGRIPMRLFWLLKGGRIVGFCGLRLRLNEATCDRGGNTGYEVRPSERGKGYATWMCRQMMAEARAHGLERVRLTCAAANQGSIGVIEKCGGVLDNESPNNDNGILTRRYWVDLR